MSSGKRAKLYRNTGTNAAPVWVEVKEAKDVDIAGSVDQVDESDRESDFKKYDDGLIDWGISFNMTHRRGNVNSAYFVAASLSGAVAEYAAMDDDITTSGATGPRFFGKVFQVGRSQPHTDGMTNQLEIKPARHEESSVVIEPSEYTIP